MVEAIARIRAWLKRSRRAAPGETFAHVRVVSSASRTFHPDGRVTYNIQQRAYLQTTQTYADWADAQSFSTKTEGDLHVRL